MLLGGAIAWLAKLAVIVATDGEQTDTGAAAVFYLSGFVLLLVGSTAFGLWLTPRGLALRIGAALLGPVAFVGSVSLLDAAAKALIGGRGPSYADDEWGILFAAVFWLAVGLVVAASIFDRAPTRSLAQSGPGVGDE